MTRPLVLYHGPGCADGFCAAWVANRRFDGEADFIPVQYGNPPPKEALLGRRRLYILDFSYSREMILSLADVNESLVVLDHHKTAEAELAGLKHDRLVCKFDMNKSGGRLAWEHFFPKDSPPWLVEFTEDRDLWRWKLPMSREISAWLASVEWTFNLGDALYPSPACSLEERFAAEGAAVLRYQSQQVENAVKNAWETVIDGHKVLCCNATMLISEIAGRLAEGRPFGATFFCLPSGVRVWSMRSREGGVDVSAIARKHGGGGHRNAAGFTEQS